MASCLAINDIEGAKTVMHEMYSSYYGAGDIKGFEGQVSALVNMCKGRLRTTFDLG
jgi:hypothetical protein